MSLGISDNKPIEAIRLLINRVRIINMSILTIVIDRFGRSEVLTKKPCIGESIDMGYYPIPVVTKLLPNPKSLDEKLAKYDYLVTVD